MAPRESSALASGPSLSIRRVFAAPRELVFAAWSEAAQQQFWLGPQGWSAPEVQLDFRVGGRYRALIRSAEGAERWMQGEYLEIVVPSRIAFSFAWDLQDGKLMPETLVQIDFVERLGQTEMHFQQGPFISEESNQGHRKGWEECFERLEEYLRELQKESQDEQ